MGGGWSDKRREIAYTEARAVIDARNATMTDIDDKAMRTVSSGRTIGAIRSLR